MAAVNKTLELKKFIAMLRAELIARRGSWAALVKTAKHPGLTYRWLVAFAGKEYAVTDAEILFELARVMGVMAQVWILTGSEPPKRPAGSGRWAVAASPASGA